MTFINIITTLLLCLQSAFAGISAYGIMYEGTIPVEEIEKYAKLNWACCGLILAISLISMLF